MKKKINSSTFFLELSYFIFAGNFPLSGQSPHQITRTYIRSSAADTIKEPKIEHQRRKESNYLFFLFLFHAIYQIIRMPLLYLTYHFCYPFVCKKCFLRNVTYPYKKWCWEGTSWQTWQPFCKYLVCKHFGYFVY